MIGVFEFQAVPRLHETILLENAGLPGDRATVVQVLHVPARGDAGPQIVLGVSPEGQEA